MRRITFLKGALSLIAVVALFMAGSMGAAAQCEPCPDWWAEYSNIWPPCDPTYPITIDIKWTNGLETSVSSNVDGHISYPSPSPPSLPVSIRVNGVLIPFGTRVKIPFICRDNMTDMCIEAEVRCNFCLEIKVKLVPC